MRQILVSLIVLAVLAPSVASAQVYTIHMSVAVRAGQSYGVSASGSKILKISSEDRLVSKDEYQVGFEGRAEVLEVDSSGRPVKLAFIVEKFTKSADGASTTLLKPGSVIMADGAQVQPFSLKDGTLDETAQEVFGVVYSAHKPNDVSDDEIFGTKELKGIGESWPVNPSQAYESFKETGFVIPEGHLEGTVTLVAKDRIASADCLSIRGDVQADVIAAKALPGGVTLERGRLQAAFRGCFPAESSGLSYKEGADISVQMRVVPKDRPKLDFTYSQKSDLVWLATGK